MANGTYMVTRRIRMLIEIWDRSPLSDQETKIGRHKYSGPPLGGGREFDDPDLAASQRGEPVIPADAHMQGGFVGEGLFA
jgi:deferrochelatase/peroxidase EfeB